MFGIALDTGARPREIALLRWSAITLNSPADSYITISPNSAKRGKSRQLALTARLYSLLDQWAQVTPSAGPHALDRPIFATTPLGDQPSVRTVQRGIAHAGSRILNRHVKPYDLRHTFATQLLRASNLRVVQDSLGHRCASTTQIYTHVQNPDILHGVQEYEAMTSHG